MDFFLLLPFEFGFYLDRERERDEGTNILAE